MVSGPDDVDRDEVEALLLECLEAADEPPVRALDRLCAQHPTHARELRRRFALASDLGLLGDSEPPRRFGDFELLEELGRGAMGVVWLAEQRSLGRRVALKLLRPGIGADDMSRRFRGEAVILGKLRHPSIAHVYETGLVAVGPGLEQPFFAMEYVDGRSLVEHADAEHLSTAARIALVAEICDAVQCAHEHGVVHRDLKPDNILVDEDGRPVVLDFGIAHVTGADFATLTMSTATGHVLGTVPYMSPEQVEGTREIDARSDVYALGVVLYELLGGRLPLDLAGASIAEAARRIQEDEPTRLGSIDPSLRGDAETIVGRALEKEPERRYASAAELAADLRRFLANEPIVARPTTSLYQLRKFARRNKALVGGVLATMVTLAAGIVVAVVLATQARRNAAAATRSQRVAERQAHSLLLSAATSALRDHDVIVARQRLDSVAVAKRGWEWRHLASRLDNSVAALAAPDGRGYELLGIPGRSEFLVSIVGAGEPTHAWWHPGTQQWSDFDAPDVAGIEWRARGLCWVGFDVVGDVSLWPVCSPRVWRVSARDLGVDASSTVTVITIGPASRRVVLGISRAGRDRYVLVDRDVARPRPLELGEHTSRIRLLDRARVVAATLQSAVILDAESGARTPLDGHVSGIVRVCTSPDATRVATGCGDGSIRLFDAATGRLQFVESSQSERVYRLEFSPDGRLLASAGWDKTVRLFDGHTLRRLRVMHGHDDRLTMLAFTGDGAHVATRTFGDNSLWLVWSTFAGDVDTLRGHASFVYPVAFSPDGERLASGGWRGASREHGEQRCWHVPTRSALDSPVYTDGGPVCALAYSPDGSRIAALDDRGWLRVRDVATGVVREREGYPGSRYGPITFHPDGERILWPAADRLEVWEPEPNRLVPATSAFLGELECGHASSDGAIVALHRPDGIVVIDTRTKRELVLHPIAGRYRKFAFARDARDRHLLLLPVASGPQAAPRSIEVRVARTGEKIGALDGHVDEVLAIAVSPDGSRIATGGRDRRIRVWDARSFAPLVALDGHTDYVFSLAWSPDGSVLASGSGDCTVRLWDTRPMREILANVGDGR